MVLAILTPCGSQRFPYTSLRCHARYSGVGLAASAGMASGLPS